LNQENSPSAEGTTITGNKCGNVAKDLTGTLLTVGEAADYLKVSESWVRRHLAELPVVRLGRAIRFDSLLLQKQLQDKLLRGKPLESERACMPYRFQRGWVKLFRRKEAVWYGGYREDKSIEGKMERVRRKVRLGTLTELPTKAAAFNKMTEIMKTPSLTAMTFQELTERWEKAEGPTLKPATLGHYKNALRAYVLGTFAKRRISDITREDIQMFLASKAKTYSKSVLRSIRVTMSMNLGWAVSCGWLERNPCEGVRLPFESGGRKVRRSVLTAQQIHQIADGLKEPYATLVHFLASTGLRIGEAIAIKWTDFDGDVLRVQRQVYEGKEGSVKTESSERGLPLPENLLSRLHALPKHAEWVFASKRGTPLNQGNVLKRHIKGANGIATKLNIHVGGWHDFRHTLTTTLRRDGVHPKVISGILGHSKVNIAMDVYDHATVQDFRQPLENVNTLLPSGLSQ
jgi:integrase